MSSPISKELKTKRITKKDHKLGACKYIQDSQKIILDSVLKTSSNLQNLNIDKAKTVKKTETNPPEPPSFRSLDSYNTSNQYVLGQINSISFYNGRFYDLLKLKKDSLSAKQTRCKCLRSKCEAKYCDCYAKGVRCGALCRCMNCKNKTDNIKKQVQANDRFCKCSKSGCLKKYCECYQSGNSCSKCRCWDWQNKAGII